MTTLRIRRIESRPKWNGYSRAWFWRCPELHPECTNGVWLTSRPTYVGALMAARNHLLGHPQ